MIQQQPEQQSGLGADQDIVKKIVAEVYGDNFETVSRVIKASDGKGLAVALPTIVNAAFTKVAKESGNIDITEALKAILEVLLMLSEDAIKTVLKQPLEEQQFNAMLKNTLALFLKKHKDIVPDSLMEQLKQAAQVVRSEGSKPAPQGQPPQPQGQPPQPQGQPPQPQQAPPQQGGLLTQGV